VRHLWEGFFAADVDESLRFEATRKTFPKSVDDDDLFRSFISSDFGSDTSWGVEGSDVEGPGL
jgi:hypothetical protein